MNIPPPKQRKPFDQEILKISDESHDDESNKVKLILDVNDNWINLIRLQLNANTQEKNEPEIEEEEEDHSQIEDQINEYKEKIQKLTEKNKDLCDLDFNSMSISEIDSEIEKTKKNILYENDVLEEYQNKNKNYQEKIDKANKNLSNRKKIAIGFYNEICAWSGPLLKTRYGPDEENPKIDVLNSDDVELQFKNHIEHLQKF